MKAKRYHRAIEKNLTKNISKARVAKEIKNIPKYVLFIQQGNEIEY